MSKAVLISIRPKWCEKIVLGEKTIEVRKTRPKMNTPFKCYIYCTAGRPDLNIPISQERLMRDYLETGSMKSMTCPLGNGKVIGEFTCNRVTNFFSNSRFWLDEDDVLHTCLSAAEMRKYANGARGLYGWHISNLKIYDEPKELGEFTGLRKTKFGMEPVAITRPFQSLGYVEELP
jgi:predicted transcriptional regulator